MKIKEIKMSVGDRVIMIKNHELRKGTIRKIYADISTPILVIEFDDGEIEKVYPKDVALEPKTERQETEPVKEEVKEKKPVEKSEITITPEEFREISTNLIAEESLIGGPLLLSLGTILVSKLHIALFADEGEND